MQPVRPGSVSVARGFSPAALSGSGSSTLVGVLLVKDLLFLFNFCLALVRNLARLAVRTRSIALSLKKSPTVVYLSWPISLTSCRR